MSGTTPFSAGRYSAKKNDMSTRIGLGVDACMVVTLLVTLNALFLFGRSLSLAV
jgi:hypothetical protein